MNRNNTKTIGKHGVAVEKPIYKRISEGLMHVAAWGLGLSWHLQTKVHETIRFDWPDPNIAKFRRAATKSVRDIRCGKILLPGKNRPKFALSHQICHQSVGHTRVSIDTVVTLALDCFVSEISLVLYRKCHLNIPLVFHPKFGETTKEYRPTNDDVATSTPLQ